MAETAMPPEGEPTADYLPTATLATLQRRAALLRQVRRFFDDRGFLEVETPLLSHDVVVDRHLNPLPVTLFADAREPEHGPTLWLQTSPEFAMKRLLAAGARAIYQVCKAFRGGAERGPRHNPEFTMLEWYRVGDDYAAGRQLLADFAAATLGRGVPEQLSYGEAFGRFAGVDPHRAATHELLAAAAGLGLLGDDDRFRFDAEHDRDAVLDLLLTGAIESRLGSGGPTILYDYPASQSALAKVRDGDCPVAERFELYCDGIELANGYHELLDPAILKRRHQVNNQARAADGRYQLPEESRLLQAMRAGLPACAGTAVGFDRLAMVALGLPTIDEAIAFPIERA